MKGLEHVQSGFLWIQKHGFLANGKYLTKIVPEEEANFYKGVLTSEGATMVDSVNIENSNTVQVRGFFQLNSGTIH